MHKGYLSIYISSALALIGLICVWAAIQYGIVEPRPTIVIVMFAYFLLLGLGLFMWGIHWTANLLKEHRTLPYRFLPILGHAVACGCVASLWLLASHALIPTWLLLISVVMVVSVWAASVNRSVDGLMSPSAQA